MPKTTPTRNRSAEAKAIGKRMISFAISSELDALIDQVRAVLSDDVRQCSRTEALERMGREGAKKLLKKA